VDECRPRLAASVAWALALVMAFQMVFTLSGLQGAMLDRVVGPGGEFSFWPNLVLAYLPAILWVVLYALLLPFVAVTPGRGFFLWALACWLPAAIIGTIAAVGLFDMSSRFSGDLAVVYLLAQISAELFVVLIVVALWRSDLFSARVVWLGFAWAGVGVITLGLGRLGTPQGALASALDNLSRYVSPALAVVFLAALAVELGRADVCLTKAST